MNSEIKTFFRQAIKQCTQDYAKQGEIYRCLEDACKTKYTSEPFNLELCLEEVYNFKPICVSVSEKDKILCKYCKGKVEIGEGAHKACQDEYDKYHLVPLQEIQDAVDYLLGSNDGFTIRGVKGAASGKEIPLDKIYEAGYFFVESQGDGMVFRIVKEDDIIEEAKDDVLKHRSPLTDVNSQSTFEEYFNKDEYIAEEKPDIIKLVKDLLTDLERGAGPMTEEEQVAEDLLYDEDMLEEIAEELLNIDYDIFLREYRLYTSDEQQIRKRLQNVLQIDNKYIYDPLITKLIKNMRNTHENLQETFVNRFNFDQWAEDKVDNIGWKDILHIKGLAETDNGYIIFKEPGQDIWNWDDFQLGGY